MSVDSDTADAHSSSGSSSVISSGIDSDTLGDGGVYTPLNAESTGNRTMSHRIHVERIQKYEQTEHDLSSMGSGPIGKTKSANNPPKTQFLKNPEPNASVSNSHSSLISIKSSGKSTDSPFYVDLDDDNELQIGPLNDLSVREELQPKIPTRAVTVAAGIRPIKETKARMSISSSEKRYINQYLLQERLGRGCFGTVRKCKDITTGHTFAMKIMNKKNLQMQLKYTWTENNKMTTSSAFESVQQEISIMKRLRHPNILNLIEIIYSDDVLYLILEYMPHGSLAESNHIIQKIDCEKSDKLRKYMRDMVSGLAYLHSQRICHSDLKPENILVGDHDILKLADFGISRFLDHGQSKRVFQEKEGTLAFQAPECLLESNTKFSLFPTDIWALGVTLYQLKYGCLPFYHEQNEGLVKKIVNKPVQLPPSEKDKDFIDLIHRMLHKDPSKRIKIRELCDHPWITKRGALLPLQSVFNILSPTKKGERVMTKLTKFSSARNRTTELVMAVKPVGRPRAKTTRGDSFFGDLISAPIVKKSGSITPSDLETINETKAEESNLDAELMKKLEKSTSTQSLRGCQHFKASARTNTEKSLELDGLVSIDADFTPGDLSRAITDRLPKPRNHWSDNTSDMFSVYNETRSNGATRLGHKQKVTFQERKINIDDMKLPFGFEEEKEQKSRII